MTWDLMHGNKFLYQTRDCWDAYHQLHSHAAYTNIPLHRMELMDDYFVYHSWHALSASQHPLEYRNFMRAVGDNLIELYGDEAGTENTRFVLATRNFVHQYAEHDLDAVSEQLDYEISHRSRAHQRQYVVYDCGRLDTFVYRAFIK